MSEAFERDIIETTDGAGQPLYLMVERYFYYNGEEYVLLREVEDGEGAPIPGDSALHVMRVEIDEEDGEETEAFVPVDEALEDSLLQAAQIHYQRPEETPTADE